MRRQIAVAAAMMALAGCQQTTGTTATAHQAAQVGSAPTPGTRSTPSASPTPEKPLELVVERTGASIGPSGFTAIALVSNPTAETAVDVRIEIDARSSAGVVLARGRGKLPRIGPMSKQAIAVRVPQGNGLPASFQTAITAVSWLASISPAPDVSVESATFVPEPLVPQVHVAVANHTGHGVPAVVTSVCYDAAGSIRGGGSQATTIPADPSVQVVVYVDIPVTPALCEGYVETS